MPGGRSLIGTRRGTKIDGLRVVAGGGGAYGSTSSQHAARRSCGRKAALACIVLVALVPAMCSLLVVNKNTNLYNSVAIFSVSDSLPVPPLPLRTCNHHDDQCLRIQCETWSKSWNAVSSSKRKAWEDLKCREKFKKPVEKLPRSRCPAEFPREYYESSRRRIDALRDKYGGERCVLVGNGPSLNDMRWDWQENFNVVMGTNKIYIGLERFNITRMNFYASCNTLVVRQSKEEIWGGMSPRVVKFIRDIPKAFSCDTDPSDRGIHFLHSSINGTITKLFSTDPKNGMIEGGTVTYYSLQILYWIGCAEVYIIGMDHNFKQSGLPNKRQHMTEPDPNHFDTSYFQGYRWHLADLNQSEDHYRLANQFYNRNGRKIYDATPGGKCTIFDKVNWKVELYKKSNKYNRPKRR